MQDQERPASIPGVASELAPFSADVYVGGVDRAELITRLASLLEGFDGLLEAYLFGSQARGEASALSDIDVAIYVDPAHLSRGGADADVEVATALMAALGTNQIDVVLLNRADPVLYHRVLRDGVRLLSRDLKQTTVREGRAISRYCDYVPQLKKIEAARLARRKRGEFGR